VYVTQLNGLISRATLGQFQFDTVLTSTGNASAVTFSADGQEAYTEGNSALAFRVIDATTETLAGNGGPVLGDPTDVVINPGGTTAYVSTDTIVYAFDIATRAAVDQAPLGVITHLVHHPTLPLLYASVFSAGRVYELNAQLDTVRSFGPFVHPQDLQLTSDASTLVMIDQHGSLNLIDLSSGSITPFAPQCSGFGLIVTRDDQQAYVGCSGSGAIKVIDLATGVLVKTISTTGFPRRMALTEDGLMVVVANEFGLVHLIW
jgi:DNA-binding beta-propeller fold protein YncE